MNTATEKPAKERGILMCGEMVVATLADLKSQTRRLVTDKELVELFDFLGGEPGEDSDGLRISHVRDFGRYDDEDGKEHYRYTGLLVQSEACPEGAEEIKCPYGVPGDRLWVRETFAPHKLYPRCRVAYKADMKSYGLDGGWAAPGEGGVGLGAINPDTLYHLNDFGGKWRPSIFMPRWASRITLEITHIRVERACDISEADAIAEGIRSFTKDGKLQKYWPCDPWEGFLKRAWVDLPRSPKDAFRALFESINGPGSWEKWVWAITFKRLKQELELGTSRPRPA